MGAAIQRGRKNDRQKAPPQEEARDQPRRVHRVSKVDLDSVRSGTAELPNFVLEDTVAHSKSLPVIQVVARDASSMVEPVRSCTRSWDMADCELAPVREKVASREASSMVEPVTRDGALTPSSGRSSSRSTTEWGPTTHVAQRLPEEKDWAEHRVLKRRQAKQGQEGSPAKWERPTAPHFRRSTEADDIESVEPTPRLQRRHSLGSIESEGSTSIRPTRSRRHSVSKSQSMNPTSPRRVSGVGLAGGKHGVLFNAALEYEAAKQGLDMDLRPTPRQRRSSLSNIGTPMSKTSSRGTPSHHGFGQPRRKSLPM